MGEKNFDENKIIGEQYIGEGSYGEVAKVAYKVGESDPSKGKSGVRHFAIKRFKEVPAYLIYKPEEAEKSVQIYDQLKQLGIPTWGTYRISRDGRSVLMSLKGGTENQYLIFWNNRISRREGKETDYSRLLENRVPEIVNLEPAVESLIETFSDLEKVIYVDQQPNDAVGISFDKGTSKIEVLFGDFDNVRIENADIKLEGDIQNMTLVRDLISQLKSFVYDFVDRNNPKRRSYLTYLSEKTKDVNTKINELTEELKRTPK